MRGSRSDFVLGLPPVVRGFPETPPSVQWLVGPPLCKSPAFRAHNLKGARPPPEGEIKIERQIRMRHGLGSNRAIRLAIIGMEGRVAASAVFVPYRGRIMKWGCFMGCCFGFAKKPIAAVK